MITFFILLSSNTFIFICTTKTFLFVSFYPYINRRREGKRENLIKTLLDFKFCILCGIILAAYTISDRGKKLCEE